MTDFNVSFSTEHGEIVIYEGANAIIVKQRQPTEEKKVIIDPEDWDSFVHAVMIADKKRRKPQYGVDAKNMKEGE